ncbi:hypothetical protein Bhyg_06470 [Pseudolycoriella hygida]|uniref:Uncharacterized protein n=1 Tax=Pseudolycoriella hygida TaxID=35572 RepID=A0A9Q0N1S6_9DIPT|nr:hypothetical protein Bhyg_06470 [Pseudolycoriella hygida]
MKAKPSANVVVVIGSAVSAEKLAVFQPDFPNGPIAPRPPPRNCFRTGCNSPWPKCGNGNYEIAIERAAINEKKKQD